MKEHRIGSNNAHFVSIRPVMLTQTVDDGPYLAIVTPWSEKMWLAIPRRRTLQVPEEGCAKAIRNEAKYDAGLPK